MGFGMMAGKMPGKKEMKPASKNAPMPKGAGNPKNTMGGKGKMTAKGNTEKMPGAKDVAPYMKSGAPSDVGVRAQKKMLPAKGKAKAAGRPSPNLVDNMRAAKGKK